MHFELLFSFYRSPHVLIIFTSMETKTDIRARNFSPFLFDYVLLEFSNTQLCKTCKHPSERLILFKKMTSFLNIIPKDDFNVQITLVGLQYYNCYSPMSFRLSTSCFFFSLFTALPPVVLSKYFTTGKNTNQKKSHDQLSVNTYTTPTLQGDTGCNNIQSSGL